MDTLKKYKESFIQKAYDNLGIKIDSQDILLKESQSDGSLIKVWNNGDITLYYNPQKSEQENLERLEKGIQNCEQDLQRYHQIATIKYFKKELTHLNPEEIKISEDGQHIEGLGLPFTINQSLTPKENLEKYNAPTTKNILKEIIKKNLNEAKEKYPAKFEENREKYNQLAVKARLALYNQKEGAFHQDYNLKLNFIGFNEKGNPKFLLMSDRLEEPIPFIKDSSGEGFIKKITAYSSDKSNFKKSSKDAQSVVYNTEDVSTKAETATRSSGEASTPSRNRGNTSKVPGINESPYSPMPGVAEKPKAPKEETSSKPLEEKGNSPVLKGEQESKEPKPYDFMPTPPAARNSNPYSPLSDKDRQAVEEYEKQRQASNGEKDMPRRKTKSITPERTALNTLRSKLDELPKKKLLDQWFDKDNNNIFIENGEIQINNLPPELGFGTNIRFKIKVKEDMELGQEFGGHLDHLISVEQGKKKPPIIDLKPEEKLKEKDMATSKPEEFAAMFKDYLKNIGIENVQVKLGNEGNTTAPGMDKTFNIVVSLPTSRYTAASSGNNSYILQAKSESSWVENLRHIENNERHMEELRETFHKPKPSEKQELEANIGLFLNSYSQKELNVKESKKAQEEIHRAPKEPLMGEIAAVQDYFIKRLKEDYNLTINRTYFRQEGNKISIEPRHGYFKAKILYDGNLSPEKMFENFVKESKRKVSLEEHYSLDRRIHIKDGLSEILAEPDHSTRKKSLDLLNKISKPVTEEYIAFELRKSLKDPSKQNEAKVLASLFMYSRGEDISPDGIRIDNQSQILANGRYVKFLNQTGELNEAVRQSASRTTPEKPEVIEKAKLSEGEYVKRIQAVYSSKIQQADLSLDTTPEHITVTKNAEGVYRVTVDTNLKGRISFDHNLDTDVNSTTEEFKRRYNGIPTLAQRAEKNNLQGMTATVRSSIEFNSSLQGAVEGGGQASIWGEVYFPSGKEAPQIGSPENLGKAPKSPPVHNLATPPALKAGENARSTSSLSNYDDEVLRFIRSSLVEPQEKYLEKLLETQKQIKEKKAALAEAKPEAKETLVEEIKVLKEKEKGLHEERRTFEQKTYSGLSKPETFPNTTFVPIKWSVPDKDGIQVSTIENPNTKQTAVSLRYKTGVGYGGGKGTARQLTEMPKVESGPVHLSLVLQNSNGQATPASEALYFTAHMDKDNVVHEVTYPKPARTDSVDNLDFDTLMSTQFTDKQLKEVVYLDRDPTASLPVNLKTLREFEIKKAITKGIIKDKSYEQVVADIYGAKDSLGVVNEKEVKEEKEVPLTRRPRGGNKLELVDPKLLAENEATDPKLPAGVKKKVDAVKEKLRTRGHSADENQLKSLQTEKEPKPSVKKPSGASILNNAKRERAASLGSNISKSPPKDLETLQRIKSKEGFSRHKTSPSKSNSRNSPGSSTRGFD